ncbi:hypothetical protein POJ06DRAFT_248514 [Lipomyces tetrasporus]|uniref:Transmembrane protein n=1 Tax=Lipomyces tetrasporus TaxID=54092 RepID=A0AAD7VUN2_9ASCO|nr:uncharacterized protein POJ06DRAFT_248514 [Lipomyces tetrasporus]KAJ8102009.1 hypothetical protein POJ06DRAFT_248514 [Lipomyces tetrasporus]
MKRSQYFAVLLPALGVLHGLLLLPLALPKHGAIVTPVDVLESIILGLTGFCVLLGLRLFLSLFPLSSVYTTSLLLFLVGVVEEIVHFLLLRPIPKATWHPAYILGFSWSVAECAVSLYQLVPPRQYRYSRLNGEDDSDEETAVPALSANADHPRDNASEIDMSLDPEEQDLLSPGEHGDQPHPAATFSAAAAISQRQREDPIAPLIGTSLLDLPTYFPFLWRTSALLHHLGFSLLLSLQDVGQAGIISAVIFVCLYRGILRSIWGIGIMRFGVVTVTFLTLVGGLLSLVVGLSLWRAI